MKTCWLDLRDLPASGRAPILEEAVHQRVDGIMAARAEDLADVPPTVSRVLLADGADGVGPGVGGLERASAEGPDGDAPRLPDWIDVVIVSDTRLDTLDALRAANPKVEFGAYVDVRDHASLEAACTAAKSTPWTLIRFRDPTKIPLEIVLAAADATSGRVVTFAGDLEEAEIILGVLERGSDGVALAPARVGVATTLKQICAAESGALNLVELTVTGVRHIGMGDRACVDTCTHLRKDEGILVGSHAKGLVLACSETHPLPYMKTRPFRVNAGAIHSYTLALAGRTNYLSELRAGGKVLAVDAQGRTRPVAVGRVKIESRPLLSVDAEAESGDAVNLIVQDDWHVRLLGPGAVVLNVTELTPGTKLLGYLPSEERHVGYPIDEFCIEI